LLASFFVAHQNYDAAIPGKAAQKCCFARSFFKIPSKSLVPTSGQALTTSTASAHINRSTDEALSITHIFSWRVKEGLRPSPGLKARPHKAQGFSRLKPCVLQTSYLSSSRRSSFAMLLGGKLRFPGGGVFGHVCIEMHDEAATVGPRQCHALADKPTRRHPRLGSGASLPRASRRRTFATRTREALGCYVTVAAKRCV